ncbi:hypothetical protein C8R45DRAFT_1078868 [Mycena sanguinolenta]|nr:hypothetical protein C8R45DRAFT_1078868 [Mycena sanguinolenta]
MCSEVMFPQAMESGFYALPRTTVQHVGHDDLRDCKWRQACTHVKTTSTLSIYAHIRAYQIRRRSHWGYASNPTAEVQIVGIVVHERSYSSCVNLSFLNIESSWVGIRQRFPGCMSSAAMRPVRAAFIQISDNMDVIAAHLAGVLYQNSMEFGGIESNRSDTNLIRVAPESTTVWRKEEKRTSMINRSGWRCSIATIVFLLVSSSMLLLFTTTELPERTAKGEHYSALFEPVS